MNKLDVLQRLKENHQALRAYGVSRLGLFGSFKRGEATANSDVDILVVFEPSQKTFLNFMDLSFFLEDLLGRKVDLLTPESLSPIFGHKILAEVEYVLFS
jgi:predicted nucleotidyltransferase